MHIQTHKPKDILLIDQSRHVPVGPDSSPFKFNDIDLRMLCLKA